LHWAHGLSAAVPEISTALSLAVIGAVLAITTVASLARARAGRLPPHEERDGVGGQPPRSPRNLHDASTLLKVFVAG
jgi:hypothetical protein